MIEKKCTSDQYVSYADDMMWDSFFSFVRGINGHKYSIYFRDFREKKK